MDKYSKAKVLASMGMEVVDQIPQIRVLVASVPEGVLPMVISALSRNPFVDFVEENRWVPPTAIPNDQYYGFQWHLNKVGAPGAWDISLGDPNVVIAVLDSGADLTHPDLAGKLLGGYNFCGNSYDVMDYNGHGTAVAGVVAAATGNSLGVAAIGWRCSILPVRVTDDTGYSSYSLLAKGLTYAADRGARVAVMSFQVFGAQGLSIAAQYFMNKGGLVFASGGNTGSYVGDADNPYIVSVSGTTSSDACWGTYGPFIDLSAPCSAIYTTIKGGGYGNVGGTSFSAPLAAGLAALIFSAKPSLTPSQVEGILESTAVDLGNSGYDINYGWGRMDASKALMAISGTNPPPPDINPPMVSVNYPTDGATVSGSITVKVGASDDVGVAKVEQYKDGSLFATDVASPYEFTWNTALDPDGSHNIAAKAYDAAGNVGASSTVTVIVSNAPPPDTISPTVAVTYPTDGATVSGSVTVKVGASDNVGVAKVELYKDGSLFATDVASPYEFAWNTASDADGSHQIMAKSYDAAGNVGASSAVTITVSNAPPPDPNPPNTVDTTPPNVRVDKPSDGAKVSGFVEISATATDESSISKVEFYINGQLKSTVSTAPYVYRWNSKNVKDGLHTISVKAYDKYGNGAEASIRVDVSNKK